MSGNKRNRPTEYACVFNEVNELVHCVNGKDLMPFFKGSDEKTTFDVGDIVKFIAQDHVTKVRVLFISGIWKEVTGFQEKWLSNYNKKKRLTRERYQQNKMYIAPTWIKTIETGIKQEDVNIQFNNTDKNNNTTAMQQLTPHTVYAEPQVKQEFKTPPSVPLNVIPYHFPTTMPYINNTPTTSTLLLQTITSSPQASTPNNNGSVNRQYKKRIRSESTHAPYINVNNFVYERSHELNNSANVELGKKRTKRFLSAPQSVETQQSYPAEPNHPNGVPRTPLGRSVSTGYQVSTKISTPPERIVEAESRNENRNTNTQAIIAHYPGHPGPIILNLNQELQYKPEDVYQQHRQRNNNNTSKHQQQRNISTTTQPTQEKRTSQDVDVKNQDNHSQNHPPISLEYVYHLVKELHFQQNQLEQQYEMLRNLTSVLQDKIVCFEGGSPPRPFVENNRKSLKRIFDVMNNQEDDTYDNLTEEREKENRKSFKVAVPNNPNMLLTTEHIEIATKLQKSTIENFATQLVMELFSHSEGKQNKNTKGTKAGKPIDSEKIDLVKTILWRFYPDAMKERGVWTKCLKSIDERLRLVRNKETKDGQKMADFVYECDSTI